MATDPQIVQGAYDHCLKLARNRFENFPMLSKLVPRRQRLALAAVYAFARQAQDYALLPAFENSRDEMLDEWSGELDKEPQGPVFTALADARERFRIPTEPLKDLARSFKDYQRGRRFNTWADLVESCRLSANPLGRLILRMFDKDTLDAVRESDAFCTALKLTGYWENLAVDFYTYDRLYIPQDDCGAYGVPEVDLRQRRFRPGLTQLIALQTARTRELFMEAKGLPWRLKGRMGVELKLTMTGGLEILKKIGEEGCNPLVRKPVFNDNDWLKLVLKALFFPVH